MTPEEIEAIVLRLAGRDFLSAEVVMADARLALHFGDGGAEEISGTWLPENPYPETVDAPCPGRLRCTHPLGQTTIAEPGQTVAAGDVLAYVEAGGHLRAIRAPRALTLGPCLVEDGSAVGYGTPVFQIMA